MNKQSLVILNAFNNHFNEFIEDIVRIFPEDKDVLMAKQSFILAKQANPKLIIKIWKSFIVEKYMNEINEGDIGFFINKDYSTDINSVNNSDKIIDAINRLRGPVINMSPMDQMNTMKYIQNLTKLNIAYFSQ